MSDLDDYLDQIQAPEALRARIQELLDAYRRIVDLSSADVFVSDVIDDEGNRSFPSMWVFTDHAAYEAQLSSGNGDELDGTPISGRVVHWVSRTRDFSFAEVVDSSRMHVEVWFPDELFGELKATGANCARLAKILRDRIEANLSRVVSKESH